MQITYQQLLAAMTEFSNVRFLQRGFSPEYARIRVLTGADAACEAGSTVFLLDGAPPESVDGAPHCFVCAGPDEPRAKPRPCDDLIWIGDAGPLTEILCRLMERLMHIQQWCAALDLLNAGGAPLKTLMDKGFEMLKTPAIVWDGGFRVLAWTEKASSGYPLYNETIGKGYTAAEVMQKLRHEDYFTAINRSSHAVLKKAIGNEDFSNIYRKLSCGDTILGYCCAFCEDRQLPYGFVELFDLFCSCLEALFVRERNSIQQSNYMYESFLIELMTDPEVPADRIRERLKYLPDIPFRAEFILIQLHVRNRDVFPVKYLYYELANSFTKSKMVIYREDLYILHTFGKVYSDRNKVMGRVLQDLNRVIQTNDVLIGLSNPFSQLNKIHYAYIQCGRAVQIGPVLHPEERLVNYRDIYLFHLFECAAREMELSSVYDDRLRALKELGEENNLDYLHILYVYLKNERRATGTAAELNLHRNTVLYHIKRIEEFLNMDFEDPMIRTSYLIAFSIMRWEKAKAENRERPPE